MDDLKVQKEMYSLAYDKLSFAINECNIILTRLDRIENQMCSNSLNGESYGQEDVSYFKFYYNKILDNLEYLVQVYDKKLASLTYAFDEKERY